MVLRTRLGRNVAGGIAGAVVAACLALAGANVALAADKPTNVTAADQIGFQQQTARAQMQELQERMFRLGETVRESEPDDSARLLMAVRRAREELILEQMKDVLDLLGKSNYGRATQEQQQLVTKLEELKKLLTSNDLDFQMRLQQLRQLKQTMAQLDAAIREEQRLKAQSGDLARAPATQPAAADRHLDRARGDQQQNRRATETLAERSKDLGADAAKASAALGAASRSMALAEGSLGAKKPGDAEPKQEEAVESMRQARRQLEEQRQKLLEQMEGEVRKQVVANLQDMLDRERNVRESTEIVTARGGSGDPQTAAKLRAIAPPQEAVARVCQATIELVEETEFSIALPPALAAVRGQMDAVAASLAAGTARDGAVVAEEKRIEQDLRDLLDTFKKLAGATRPSDCKGGSCKGDKNKILAELKALRMVQARAAALTADADAARGTPAYAERASAARDRQVAARDVADRLHRATCDHAEHEEGHR